MNEEKIIKEYAVNKKSLRDIALELNTNHHRIKRILIKNNIEIDNKGRKRKPFTDEHKKKISEATKGRKGVWENKKMPKESLYKNMLNHLQWEVDIEFLKKYEDVEKLKALNKMLSRERVSCNFTTEKYINFIEKFYYDEKFNSVYNDWLKENKKEYAKPSLDHIVPLSKGGTWELENLQILSWVENRAKYNFMPEEWEYIKSKYFIKGGD